MSSYTLSADTNIDALTSKGGGDLYYTNGWKLTIDQDSRTGLNQTTSAALGNITITAAKGGEVHIDGTSVWMIPYTGGSGNVPAWNTAITQSGQSGSGKLIGVHSSLTAASTNTGAAMPASGYLRVKQKTGAYVAGALTGIAATASDAGRVGWLEIVGVESNTISANRLGVLRITGAWFSLGTTSGSPNQTLQIPNNGLSRYVGGVFIEKTAGQADYEFYPNAGTALTIGTEAARGKVVWIDATGLVRIGDNGSGTSGYTPTAGLAVVVPNIFFENCTSAAKTANVIPSPTLGTRYDFTTTGGGVVIIDKASMAWYLSAVTCYSLQVTDSAFIDQILVQQWASPLVFNRVGVGNKPTTELADKALNLYTSAAGGTFTDCVFARATQGTSSSYIASFTDISGCTFVRCIFRANTVKASSLVYSISALRVTDCTFTNCTIVQSPINLSTCQRITCTDLAFTDCASGLTDVTNSTYVWQVQAMTTDCVFSGLSFPVENTHPRLNILNIATASCARINLRNIGSRVASLPLGSINATRFTCQLSAATDIKVQRVYCSAPSLGAIGLDASSTRCLLEHVYASYVAVSDNFPTFNTRCKGLSATLTLTARTSVYGTHWIDCFTSTTAGAITILMNEPTSLTAGVVSLTGGAAFDSAGELYMPTIGQTATFTMPEYVQGHTGFQDSALVMGLGTATNYTYRYQIDKNDGNGFSAWSASKTSTTLGTALNSETNIDASKGFKLKLEITTGTTNTTPFTYVNILTDSSTTAQDYQYPLDTNTLTLTGLPVGCDAVVLAAGTTTILDQTDSMAGTSYIFTYSGAQNVDVGLFKPGYVPYYIRGLALTTTNASIPISLVPDRNYT